MSSIFDLEKRQEFLHCPFMECNGTFKAPWENYAVGIDEKGITVYRCPVCMRTFTCEDMAINAVKVQENPNGVFIFYDERRAKVVFRILGNTAFTDGTCWYIHVPSKILSLGHRMFSVSDASMSDADIVAALDKFFKEEQQKSGRKASLLSINSKRKERR